MPNEDKKDQSPKPDAPKAEPAGWKDDHDNFSLPAGELPKAVERRIR